MYSENKTVQKESFVIKVENGQPPAVQRKNSRESPEKEKKNEVVAPTPKAEAIETKSPKMSMVVDDAVDEGVPPSPTSQVLWYHQSLNNVS